MGPIILLRTAIADLETLFDFQRDEDAARIAAFMNKEWKNKEAYLVRWGKLLENDSVNCQTIVLDNNIVGSVSTWQSDGLLHLTYWIGKEFWNQGIATAAVKQFLETFPERPVLASTAYDNVASIKVLANCGFTDNGTDRGFAEARQQEITERKFVLAG